MTVKLIKFRDKWLRVGKTSLQERHIERLHFIIIEEPEAHLHVQAQQVFINNSYELLTRYKDVKNKIRYHYSNPSLHTQLLVTTHSSHIVYEVDFSSLRYFDRSVTDEKKTPLSIVKNLSSYFNSEDESRRFAARYLKLHHCDIFFSDALILLEGASEKLLVPQFIKDHYQDLDRRYISYIDIGGDYAQIFRPLIEELSLDTLIVTDLDSVDSKTKKCRPKKSAGQVSSNAIINDWLCDKESPNKRIDDLVALPDEQLTLKVNQAEIYFAYQKEVNVSVSLLNKKTFNGDVIPRTFEDALIISNLESISSLSKKIEQLPTKDKSQIKKVITDLEVSENLDELMSRLYTRLNTNDKEAKIEGVGEITKAALAVELLFVIDPTSLLAPPQYIKNCLEWLQKKLSDKDLSNAGVTNEQ